jgi:hypothetical protein
LRPGFASRGHRRESASSFKMEIPDTGAPQC